MVSMDEQHPIAHTHGLVIHWAARYDLLAWLFTRGREREFRERIVSLARLQRGESVLDIGCGTGTLALVATRHVGPTGEVQGIDASPEMIARARRKAAKTDAATRFQVAVAEELPFPDGRFDVVLSTLMLHHLPRATRQACAREVARVLKPNGRVLVVDFVRTQRKGFLSHFHRHGHVVLDDVMTMFANNGLTVSASGPAGMRDLHFMLAQKRALDDIARVTDERCDLTRGVRARSCSRRSS
jgi:ubiquinone/menaquinone biosynthesis C-methylase UbiE